MQAATQTLMPGARIGRYEIIGRLAVGGMAELYLARVTGLEGFRKLVVLKRILPERAANKEFVRMFLDEARLAALLQHPNIAQVYDIGSVDGHYFFTMEYVHGESLQKVLAASRFAGRDVPLDQAIAIGAGIAAGLHHAHEKTDPEGRPLGIVHRDVSPSNVLVTYEGGVKVVDFGVAKAAERQAKTRAGTLKGKVAYMSPEQCRGEHIDRRSDVFSIGIVLYELTTGVRPFQGENEFTVLQHITARDPPPPSAVRPGYPAALEKIVLRSLRRDPEERYPTAQALQVDLEAFAREQKLLVSSVALASFMEQLFGKKRDAWSLDGDDAGASEGFVSISVVVEDGSGLIEERRRSGRRLRRAASQPWSWRVPVRPAVALLLGAGLAAIGFVWLGHDRAPAPGSRPAPSVPVAHPAPPSRSEPERGTAAAPQVPAAPLARSGVAPTVPLAPASASTSPSGLGSPSAPASVSSDQGGVPPLTPASALRHTRSFGPPSTASGATPAARPSPQATDSERSHRNTAVRQKARPQRRPPAPADDIRREPSTRRRGGHF